jgi:hypothetical protein
VHLEGWAFLGANAVRRFFVKASMPGPFIRSLTTGGRDKYVTEACFLIGYSEI